MEQIELGSLSYHAWPSSSQTPMEGCNLPYSRNVTKVNNFPGITPHPTSFLHTLFESQSQCIQLGVQLIKLIQLPQLCSCRAHGWQMSPLSYQTSLLPNYSQLHSHISAESTAVQVEVNYKAGRKHIKF